MSECFINPSLDEIRALLQRIKAIAVVDLSNSPGRPSHQVAAALQNLGYRIIPVNPVVDRVMGELAYPEWRAVSEPINLVGVFRSPEPVAGLVDECIALRLPALWLQDGVLDATAARRAQAAGIQVMMNRCL